MSLSLSGNKEEENEDVPVHRSELLFAVHSGGYYRKCVTTFFNPW
jgi:hypothetical protein